MRDERVLDAHLIALIDQIDVLGDQESVRITLQRFSQACGFERFAYTCTGGNELYGLSDYAQEWQHVYVDRNLKAVDPVMRLGRQAMQPFGWAFREARFQGMNDRAFFKEAERFGICSGFSMPIPTSYGRFAMLTLASGDSGAAEGVVVRNAVRAATAVAFVHWSLKRLSQKCIASDETRLTGREATCLTWASFGKTATETAALVGISDNTVRFYLVQARDRLGASNVSHAIRLAIEKGLI